MSAQFSTPLFASSGCGVIAIVSIDFALFLAGCYEFIMMLNITVDVYDFIAWLESSRVLETTTPNYNL